MSSKITWKAVSKFDEGFQDSNELLQATNNVVGIDVYIRIWGFTRVISF
jgi:hypothetical protein